MQQKMENVTKNGRRVVNKHLRVSKQKQKKEGLRVRFNFLYHCVLTFFSTFLQMMVEKNRERNQFLFLLTLIYEKITTFRERSDIENS